MGGIVLVLVLCFALGVAMILYAVNSERGTRYVWQAATSLLGGQLTGGSTSIRYAWEPMRKAGATARVLLISAAAQQWQVDPASCHAERGEVVHAASNRRVGYGQLVDAAAKLPGILRQPV